MQATVERRQTREAGVSHSVSRVTNGGALRCACGATIRGGTRVILSTRWREHVDGRGGGSPDFPLVERLALT